MLLNVLNCRQKEWIHPKLNDKYRQASRPTQLLWMKGGTKFDMAHSVLHSSTLSRPSSDNTTMYKDIQPVIHTQQPTVIRQWGCQHRGLRQTQSIVIREKSSEWLNFCCNATQHSPRGEITLYSNLSTVSFFFIMKDKELMLFQLLCAEKNM